MGTGPGGGMGRNGGPMGSGTWRGGVGPQDGRTGNPYGGGT